MGIPTVNKVMLPVLQLVLDQEMHYSKIAIEISQQFDLTEEERNRRTTQGTVTIIQSRVLWANTHMYKAGIISRPKLGCVVATPEGKGFCMSHPKGFGVKELADFQKYKEWRREKPDQSPLPESDDRTADEEQSPQERLDVAYKQLDEMLRDELLAKLRSVEPQFFEQITLDLMVALGYCSEESAHPLGRSGDGGVDGIVEQDVLGLEAIYLQAKRWDKNNTVGSREIRDFIGALAGTPAKKGVFITSSSFSNDAKKKAKESSVGGMFIKLIDGEELTRLLIEHELGVVPHGRPVVVKRIDQNYFEGSEEEESKKGA